MKQPKQMLRQWNLLENLNLHKNESDPYEPIYLRVPYLWYVLTKTRVKIMCDENIKSPHPYIASCGTAWWKPNEHHNNQKGVKAKELKNNSILTINQEDFKDTIWMRQCSKFRPLHDTWSGVKSKDYLKRIQLA